MNLSADSKTTVTVPVLQSLVVTVPAGTTGSVVRLSNPEGGAPYAPVALDGADVTFGPYNVPAMFRIECNVGSLSYAIGIPDPLLMASDAEVAAGYQPKIGTDVLDISGAGVPVDYTDGSPPATGEGTAGIGSRYTDVTNGNIYINAGTKAQPIWKLVTRAA